jgi:hypothetical protein
MKSLLFDANAADRTRDHQLLDLRRAFEDRHLLAEVARRRNESSAAPPNIISIAVNTTLIGVAPVFGRRSDSTTTTG